MIPGPALASFLFVAGCGVVAVAALRALGVSDEEDGVVARLLKGVLVYFAVFFGTFYLLGFVDLATHARVVSSAYGLLVLVAAFAVLVLKTWMGRRRAGDRAAPKGLATLRLRLSAVLGDGVARVVAITTALTMALLALMVAAGFPLPTEAVAYHLPMAVEIFQSRSLRPYDGTYLHLYTANASLYFGVLLQFLSEHFVAPANLVFAPVIVLAVYGLARETGADRNASRLAACGVLSVPLVAFPVIQNVANPGGMAFIAVAAYFALRSSGGAVRNAVLSGLAAGLAYGFKQNFLIAGALLFVPHLWHGRREIKAGLAWLKPAACYAGAAAAASGFWLVRNYVETGNPVYPVYVAGLFDLLGWPMAPDYDYGLPATFGPMFVRSALEWLVYPWVEWHSLDSGYRAGVGVGAFFAAMVPVAFAAAALEIARRGRSAPSVVVWLVAGTLCVVTAWWFLGAHHPRYMLDALVMLVPLVAWMVGGAQGRWRTVLHLVALASILPMQFAVLSRIGVMFGDRTVYARLLTRHAWYEYPKEIDALPPGSTVVNLVFRTWNYQLLGDGHRNRVVSFNEADYNIVALKETIHAEPVVRLTIPLRAGELRRHGATHLYTMGNPTIVFDDCSHVETVASLDRNPQNGVALEHPYRLSRIYYCGVAATAKR